MVGSADTVVRFTDDVGQILIKGLTANRYRVRARELGFAPTDTVIVVADPAVVMGVTFRLEAVAHPIAPVIVSGKRQCHQGGLPNASGSGANDDLSVVGNEIRENANRVRLFADAYPFIYQRETVHLELEGSASSSRTLFVDTSTYDSRLHSPYEEGRVVRITRDQHGNRTRLFLLPTLADLADTAFERLHCFWLAGRDSGADGLTLKVDVRPRATIHTPDVTAQFYLDPETYLVRRATFQLTHPEQVSSELRSERVEAHYREIAPLVAVADSVVTTTITGKPWGVAPDDIWSPESQTFVERARLLSVWDAGAQAPDTAVLGIVTDVDSADSVPMASDTTSATIRGRLIGPQGQPVAGAHLQIAGLAIGSVTGDGGQFELKDVPSGNQTLLITRIGYRPTVVSLPATLPERWTASRRLVVQLPPSDAATLTPVVVSARRLGVAYKRIGFDERRQKVRAFFLDAGQIAAMHATLLREVLGRAPGFQWVHGGPVQGSDLGTVIPGGTLRVEGDPSCDNVPQATHDHVVGDNPSCTICINYLVDGNLATFLADGRLPSLNAFAQLEAHYPPNTIAAVEMYAPSTAPAGVASAGSPDCATVVLWTKKYLGL